MGQTFSGDSGDTNKLIAKTGLSATAGGLNAAAGEQPAPVDFSAIGKASKKLRGQPATIGQGANVIPTQGPDVGVPDFNLGAPQMPELYSGNGAIPQLRKGALPFYGY